jgi:drug/metabolite transporter (DMT)-like permease
MVTIITWASSFAAITFGLEAMTPGELSLLRFAIASLCLLVPVASGWIRLPPRRDWLQAAFLGVLGIAIYQLALGYAMTRITAGAAAVIIALTPGVTSALAAWKYGERITPRILGGLVIAFTGSLLITFGAGSQVRFEPLALLALISVLCTSVYFVWQRPLLERTSPLGFTALSFFGGTIALLPFAVTLLPKLGTLPPAQWLSALYLGVFPSMIAYLTWNWALSRAPAALVTSFLYLSPLLAALIAWLWLGQVPTWLTVLGGSAALLGVMLTNSVLQLPRRAAGRLQ